jgi:hypothetical protein
MDIKSASALQGASTYAAQSVQALKENLQAEQAVAQLISQAAQVQQQQQPQPVQLATAGAGKAQVLDILV